MKRTAEYSFNHGNERNNVPSQARTLNRTVSALSLGARALTSESTQSPYVLKMKSGSPSASLAL